MLNNNEDGEGIPKGGLNNSSLPNPIKISTVVHAGKSEENTAQNISVLLMQFAQFLDHDLTLTPESGTMYQCILSTLFTSTVWFP